VEFLFLLVIDNAIWAHLHQYQSENSFFKLNILNELFSLFMIIIILEHTFVESRKPIIELFLNKFLSTFGFVWIWRERWSLLRIAILMRPSSSLATLTERTPRTSRFWTPPSLPHVKLIFSSSLIWTLFLKIKHE
jgi:hypothetical protein